ncbi:uncharacterized protein EI90DRAFT_3034507 [Cantharellus anzutake]|uniref:uncharacterized protein n=1 Tax=Cantharellus anzutake TaxID=1750568 RepID=UPI001902D87D|nr:uncharacterized protein EI90DRAFT_3034507 [Cantharellus anzutake]KAF8341577.1 hypothetical protein EI90DRAFT_3034507 [Cantharellus anzutake]
MINHILFTPPPHSFNLSISISHMLYSNVHVLLLIIPSSPSGSPGISQVLEGERGLSSENLLHLTLNMPTLSATTASESGIPANPLDTVTLPSLNLSLGGSPGDDQPMLTNSQEIHFRPPSPVIVPSANSTATQLPSTFVLHNSTRHHDRHGRSISRFFCSGTELLARWLKQSATPFLPKPQGFAPMIIRSRKKGKSREEAVHAECQLSTDADTSTAGGEDGPWVDASAFEELGSHKVTHALPSSYTTYSAHVFFHEVRRDMHAQYAKIVSIGRFRDSGMVRHRFLILRVSREGMPDFVLRVDRFRDRALSLFQFSLCHGKSDAMDTVTVSENSHLLRDGKSIEEARLDLPQPIPLLKFGRVLEIVLGGCSTYDLFAENCWFTVSILEEVFVDMFGARYAKGRKSHPRLARQTRAGIRNKLGLGDSA